MAKGSGYTLSNPEIVQFVDEYYPHALVNDTGDWYAEEDPKLLPIVGSVDANQTVAVFSSDRKYYPGLIPAMFSFLEHHPDTHVVVIDRGLSPAQIRYVQQFAEVIPSRMDVSEFEAWGRFEVSLLPYRRVVFLDSDIIVLKPLVAMFETDIEFGAVKNLDWKVTENFSDPSVLSCYKISPSLPAFFAGGFTIDNEIWGNGRLLGEANRIYKEVGQYFLYADQSALQIIMYQNGHAITYLPDEYNAIAECWDWKNLGNSAFVVHFAGGEIKPWNRGCNYPQLDKFFSYSKIRLF